MAKGKAAEQVVVENETMTENGNGNGLDPGYSATADDDNTAEGEAMWNRWLTPRDGRNFYERWIHLNAEYLAAYGEYRVVREVPTNAYGEPEITLKGKDAVNYVLGEISSPDRAGKPRNFYDACAKAAQPKPHNNRRNFGEELFDKIVDELEKLVAIPDDATRGERKEIRDQLSEEFLNTPAEECGDLDRFLIKVANDLRDSENMRRKVKTREKREAAPKPEKARPVIDRAAMLQRLAQVQ